MCTKAEEGELKKCRTGCWEYEFCIIIKEKKKKLKIKKLNSFTDIIFFKVECKQNLRSINVDCEEGRGKVIRLVCKHLSMVNIYN